MNASFFSFRVTWYLFYYSDVMQRRYFGNDYKIKVTSLATRHHKLYLFLCTRFYGYISPVNVLLTYRYESNNPGGDYRYITV